MPWLGKEFWLYNGQCNGRWQGTAAEYSALSADLVTELPIHVSFSERATLRMPGMSYLAPDITRAILDGRHPRDLTAEKLLDHSRLPLTWPEQRSALGFT